MGGGQDPGAAICVEGMTGIALSKRKAVQGMHEQISRMEASRTLMVMDPCRLQSRESRVQTDGTCGMAWQNLNVRIC